MGFLSWLSNKKETYRTMEDRRKVRTYALIVLAISFFTYAWYYAWPPHPFWDENYHVASAQKYLDGVVFHEAHPPLGKMLIALGEAIVNPNTKLDRASFHRVDHIKKFPRGYSFWGVRLFPVLFAWASAPLFFLILWRLSRRPLASLIFSSMYLFENAYIVHSRGAMLDSIQMFFIFLAVYHFLGLVQRKQPLRGRDYFSLGAIIGAVIAVKFNGAVMLLLFVFLFIHDQREQLRQWTWAAWKKTIGPGMARAGAALGGILLVVLLSFYVHFTLGRKFVAGRTYKASAEYQKVVKQGQTANPLHFPELLRCYLKYSFEYHAGVPKLQRYNPRENGSPPILWPFGHKAINYRWAKKGGLVRYLYLQGNPVLWATGLLGIFLALVLITGRIVFRTPIRNLRLFQLIILFTALYLGYMVAVMRIDRVMYLYHYFVPLFFSLILAFLVFVYVFEEQLVQGDRIVRLGMWIWAGQVLVAFLFFMPFTYYIYLSRHDFMLRAWCSLWELKHVK